MPSAEQSPVKQLGAKIKNRLADTLNVNFFVHGLFLCLMVCTGVITNNQYSITGINEARAEGIAKTVNYQARLMNSSGINVSDGTYSMKISVYNQASGGSNLWSASTSNGLPTGTPANIQVEVKNGLFSILLGDTNNGQVAFPEGLFNNDTLYLGITIGADNEMTPRKRLSAVPYAYNSQTLQGQYASNTVSNTGGDLFALNQASNDGALATRTALAIYTSGTSNQYDLLIKANSGSDVFTVSRQGNVTTTGNLIVNGSTKLNNTLEVTATSTFNSISLSGRVNSNLLPYITDTYSLGNSTYRWLGITAQNFNAVNVSSTNIDALGYISTTNLYSDTALLSNVTTTNLFASGYVSTTSLYVNGSQVTGAAPTLQEVTDEGYVTTNPIRFAGASSTGHFLPVTTLTYDLGSSSNRWRNLYASNGILTNVSSTNIDASGYITANRLNSNTANLGNVTTTNIYNSGIVSTTNLYVNGVEVTGIGSQNFQNVTDLGVATTNWIQFAGATSTNHFLPGTNNLFNLGSSAYRWANLFAVNGNFTGIVTTTNLFASGYVSTTSLYVNGSQVTGAAPTLQEVTDEGYVTTNPIRFAGASSTDQVYILGSQDVPQLIVQANTTQSLENPLIQFLDSAGTPIGGIHTNAATNFFAGLDSGAFITTGTYNTALGYQTLYNSWMDISGSYNTAIGAEAMRGYSGSNMTGSNNTAVGYRSLASLSSGYGNTAVGYESLNDNTTGYHNNAFGWSALNSNTTGLNNVAIGNEALANNISGESNVSVGNESMYNNNGDDNVAMGQSAMFLSTTADHAVAVGTRALFSNNAIGTTGVGYHAIYSNSSGINLSGLGYLVMEHNSTGSNNTAMGSASLYYNRTGSGNTSLGSYALHGFTNNSHSNNTGIGYNSLFSVRTGSGNTALGGGTLYSLTTGASNTVIGYLAGNNITTGSNNITIGAGIDVPSPTGSYQLNIGNAIYGNLSSGNIGIGDSTPASLFTVGNGDLFQVNTSGNLVRINNVPYSWPSANASGALRNDGSGNLSFNNNISQFTNDSGYITGIAGQTLASANFWVGNTSNQATAVTMSGDATMSNTGVVTVADNSHNHDGTTISGLSVSNFTSPNISNWTNDAGYITSLGNAFVQNGNSFGANAVLGTNDGYNLSLETNNTVRMTVLSTGNVGIGTASAPERLVVAGNIRLQANGNLDTSSAGSLTIGGTTQNALTVGRSGATTALTGSNFTAGGIAYGASNQLTFTSAGTAGMAVLSGGTGAPTMGTLGLTYGGTNANLSGVATGGLLYKGATAIAGTGALTGVLKGNGSSAPSAMTGTQNYVVRWSDANTLAASALIFDNGTNIGIGDSTPASLFTVGNGDLFQVNTSGNLVRINNVPYSWPSANASGALRNNGSGTLSFNNNISQFTNDSGYLTSLGNVFVQNGNSFGANAVLGTNDGYSLSFETNGTSRATIDTGGALTLLGTANTTQLAVRANASQTQPLIQLQTSAGVELARIHTNSIANLFAGYLSGSNNTGLYNSFFGGSSGVNNTTGSNNSAFGMNSLYSNTTGSYNSAFGYRAIYSNTIGGFNVALGHRAAESQTTASYVVAIGTNSLYNNNASSTIGIGYQAGYRNTTGEGNVAIGYRALYPNQTGSYNTAVGHESLGSTATNSSSNNSVFGYRTLYANTTGSNNSALGSYSLDNITTGSNNVAVGYSALTSASTANNTTAVGSEALYYNTANSNVAVGYQAGYRNTTGSGNLAIGYQALHPNRTGNFNTVVGQSAMGSTDAAYDSSYNSVFGFQAMYSNTTGSNNSAFGNNSMVLNTTGSNNSAFGNSAMSFNETGSYNTAIGTRALEENETGSYNTAIGYYALGGSGGAGSFSYNTALGVRALQQLETGSSNIAVGDYALGDLLEGDYNVAIGYNALLSSVSYRQTAVGANAFSSLTTGNFNTGVGYNVGTAVTTGSSNSFFGYESGVSMQIGWDNTAIGSYTLRYATNGSNNTAIGHYAMANGSTKGTYNTAIGSSAFSGPEAGDYNIALGESSMISHTMTSAADHNISIGSPLGDLTSGYENIAIGSLAMDSLTSGYHNVGMGYNTLNYLTTGSNNVALGRSAGGGVSTGNNNTFLGYVASASGNYSNSTAIGYTASVPASNYVQIGNTNITDVRIGGSTGNTNLIYYGILSDASDERLKTDIIDNKLGLNFITKLRPVSFTMIESGFREDGFIAQEVESAMNQVGEIFSGVRYPTEADDYYGLDYTKFTVPLVNAVQELYASSSPLFTGIAISSNHSTTTPFLMINQNGDLAYSGGSVTAQGIAGVSTTAYDSGVFSLQGSGWDNSTATAITTGFSLINKTLSSTSSRLEIGFATGTQGALGLSQAMLTITNAGDVSVSGDLTVGRRLYLGSKTTGMGSTDTYLFVDDTLSPNSTYISTNADGWQTEDAYDYAERYESDEILEPGDLVTADGSGINKIKKASSVHEPILGIVSTKPGFVTGRHYKGWYPIALAGRVPTKVSTLNGAIKAGDHLSASDKPGVAVKAVGAGNVIGIALEAYDKYEEGLISVFVKPGYVGGRLGEQTSTGGATIINQTTNTTVSDKVIEGLALIKAGASEVNISFATLQAYPMIYATPHSSVNGSWYITNRKDNGFTIIISEPQTHDVEFTWMVRPMKAGTIKFVSDNTYQAVDDLTGQVYGPVQTAPESTETTTTTEPIIDPTAGASTEPVIVPDDDQSPPESPVEDATTPTSTTNTQNHNSTTTQT